MVEFPRNVFLGDSWAGFRNIFVLYGTKGVNASLREVISECRPGMFSLVKRGFQSLVSDMTDSCVAHARQRRHTQRKSNLRRTGMFY